MLLRMMIMWMSAASTVSPYSPEEKRQATAEPVIQLLHTDNRGKKTLLLLPYPGNRIEIQVIPNNRWCPPSSFFSFELLSFGSKTATLDKSNLIKMFISFCVPWLPGNTFGCSQNVWMRQETSLWSGDLTVSLSSAKSHFSFSCCSAWSLPTPIWVLVSSCSIRTTSGSGNPLIVHWPIANTPECCQRAFSTQWFPFSCTCDFSPEGRGCRSRVAEWA